MSDDTTARAHPDVPHVAPAETIPGGGSHAPAGVGAPRCRTCDVEMRFAGGESTHDLWAARYVCPSCGRETFRSFGRGSVS